VRYLVIHDVDAIQQYVFATSRLREIRGASALVDRINRKDTRKLVSQHGGGLIYFGGGGVAAEFTDAAAASAFCRNLSAHYLNETVTASSTGAVVPYNENALDADERSFSSALRWAHYQLRQEKVSRDRATQILTNPYAKRCQACGVYPAAHYDERFPAEAGKFICEGCCRKRQQSSHISRVHQRIYRMILSQRSLSVGFPRELDEDIGKHATPERYIGVIYADGNRMGDRLLQIESKTALRGFSKTIDTATTQTIASVLAKYWEQLPAPEGRPLLPALVPLCGGDDLVVIVPAQVALEVAVRYLRMFQDQVRQSLPREVEEMIGGREVSACAGVAIGKSHVPLARLFDLAQELCRLAKKRSFDLFQRTRREEPCIDFQVVTAPNWAEVETSRSEQLLPRDNLRLTCRPYTVGEAEGLIKAVRSLKGEKFPPGKLHDLYRSLWLGRHQATFKYLTMFVRVRENAAGQRQQSALREAEASLKVLLPPWRPWPERSLAWETPYADLVEIYQFIG
jgi:hypothetical protein